MSKRRILFCNILPQIPAATSAYFCIRIRCMVLIPVNSSLGTASVCNKYKVIFRQQNILFFSLYLTFNRRCSLLSLLYIKYNICYFGIELEIHTCFFQIFLHRQDQRFILIVLCKLQGTEIRESCNVMDKSLEIQFHFQGTVPVFKSKHGSPVQPECRIEHFFIKYIFNRFIIQIFIFCHKELHNFHTAFLAQVEFTVCMCIFSTFLCCSAKRIVWIFFI